MSFNQIMPALGYSGGNYFGICPVGMVAFNTGAYRASTWFWWARKRPRDHSFSDSHGDRPANHR